MTNLMLFSKDLTEHPDAKQFSEWIQTIYDPIERGYLDKVELTIYSAQKAKKKLIEQYIFSIQWKEDGTALCSMNRDAKRRMLTKSDIRRESQKLFIQMIGISNSLKPIPEGSSYAIQIFYNDQCPKSYAPPGQFRCATESDRYFVDEPLYKQKIGKVATNHLCFCAALKTTQNRVCYDDDDEAPPIKKRKMNKAKNRIANAELSQPAVTKEIIQFAS